MAPVPFRIRLRPRTEETSHAGVDSRHEGNVTHWRSRMKRLNPEKYEAILENDVKYKRYRNHNMTEAKKEHERKITRERVKRYRMKRKEEGHGVKVKSKAKTMSMTEKKKLREGWRIKKQMQRLNWSEEKREEHNRKQRMRRLGNKEEVQDFRRTKLEEERLKKDEERMKLVEAQHQEKQEEEKRKQEEEKRKQEEEKRKQVENAERVLREEEEDVVLVTPKSTERTSIARRKALSRARSHLSPDPTIFAETLSDLIEKSTPRRKKAIRKFGIKVSKMDLGTLVAENVAKELKKNRFKRDKKSRSVRRGLVSSLQILKPLKKQKLAKKDFGTTPKLLKSLGKKDSYRNKFRTAPEVKRMIQSFYEEEAVQMPYKKNVSRKTMQNRAILQRPISSLFMEFQQAHPDVKVKKSTFFMLRPKHVKPMACNKLRGCLCEVCRNIKLKVDAINALCVKFGSPTCRIKDEFHASTLTLCQKPDDQRHHKLTCIKRECECCGVKLVREHLQPLLNKAGPDFPSKWNRWELKKTGSVSKIHLNGKDGSLCNLVDELCNELKVYPSHLFQWFWQHNKYAQLLKDPPANTLVSVLDFAENYANLLQDEVQAAHWCHQQTTIHPIVCTYRCSCGTPNCDLVVTHSLIFISDDLKHDYHSVNHFFKHCVTHLRDSHNLEVQKIIRFSDGCAAQYKSRGAFLDISQSLLPTEHHFFGPRHGKGPADGESAVVKQQASLAVKSSQAIIPTPHSLFSFAKEKLTRSGSCTSFKREFFYIPTCDINHARPVPVKAVKDTRKIACVKNGGDPLTLFHRTLSCFCQPCMTSEGHCVNSDYVTPWTSTQLQIPKVGPVDDASADGGDLASDVPEASSPIDTPHPSTGSSNSISVDRPDEERDEAHGDELSRPRIHDFVKVKVPVQGRRGRSQEEFIAQVASYDGDQLRLQYMQNHGELYFWPNSCEDQYFLHPTSDVISIMPEPEMVFIGTRVHLKF